MRFYAVIDTNVLVSAMLKWNSSPGNIMELVFDGLIVPLLNKAIMREYKEVLSRPKFHWTEKIIHNILFEINHLGRYVETHKSDIDLPDPKDRVFYEVAMEKQDANDVYLVTGNIRHFPSKSYIVTPRQMLDIIIKSTNDMIQDSK